MSIVRSLAVTAMLFGLVQAPLHADYVTQTYVMVGLGESSQDVAFPGGNPPGTVQVQAYDGVGQPGGGLNPGEVRLTFVAGSLAYPPPGFQGIAFNTDLSLAPDQIHLPTGWSSQPNLWIDAYAPSGYGRTLGDFSWGATGPSTSPNTLSVLITGLGANATLSHFLLGSNPAGRHPSLPQESAVFAGSIVYLYPGAPGPDTSSWLVTPADGVTTTTIQPAASPEPSTLLLGGLALASVFGARLSRARFGSLQVQ